MATRISSVSPAANRPCGSSRKCGISFLQRLQPIKAHRTSRTNSYLANALRRRALHGRHHHQSSSETKSHTTRRPFQTLPCGESSEDRLLREQTLVSNIRLERENFCP